MLHIVISYSRIDLPFVVDLAPHLQEAYGDDNVLYEEELGSTEPRMQEIRRKIAWCDAVLFIVSKESLISKECEAEVAEARRLGRDIVSIRIDPNIEVPLQLQFYRAVDMTMGIDESSLDALHQALRRVTARALETQPLSSIARRSDVFPKVEEPAPEPAIEEPVILPPRTPTPVPLPNRRGGRLWLWLPLLLLVGIGGLLAFNALSSSASVATPPVAATDTIDAAAGSATSLLVPIEMASATPRSTQTALPTATPLPPTLTPTATATQTFTAMPTATATASATATATYTMTHTATSTPTVTSTVTLTASATASPTPAPPTATPTLTVCQRADVNGDGQVTREDVDEMLRLENNQAAYRADLDFNADGKIDRTDTLTVNSSLNSCR